MALDTDDLEPRPTKPKPRDLDLLAVTELENYIDELRAEIARAQGAIDRKRDHRSGAESFFKKR